MDPESGGRSAFNSTSTANSNSQLSCPICKKNFQLESSQVRHVQYCRRRAARNTPARRRACQLCNRSKVKCDFGSPCSSCATKHVPCIYDKWKSSTSTMSTSNQSRTLVDHQATYTPVVDPLSQFTGLASKGDFTALTGTSHLTPLGQNFDPNELIYPDMSSDYNTDIYTNDGVSLLDHLDDSPIPFASFIPDVNPVKNCLSIPSMNNSEPSLFMSNYVPQIEADLGESCFTTACWPPVLLARSLGKELAPDMSIVKVSRSFSFRAVSNGCRAFIASVICAYPRMMLRPDTLPPFIHPHSCTHPEDSSSTTVSSISSKFMTSESLANSVSISQLFASKTPSSEKFFWRTLETEHQRIRDEVPIFGKTEALAASQAMLIYIIMRFIGCGPSFFSKDMDMFKTLGRLARRFSDLCPGPFSVVDTGQLGHDWEEWIFHETRRRFAIVCFLLTVIAVPESPRAFMNPHVIPLPSSKVLWEAGSHQAWEVRYKALCTEGKDSERLHTLGDLFAAQYNMVEQSGVGDSGRIALDAWLAGADALGIMLTTVTSGI